MKNRTEPPGNWFGKMVPWPGFYLAAYAMMIVSLGLINGNAAPPPKQLPFNARFLIVDHDEIFTMDQWDTRVKLLVKNTGTAKWQGDVGLEVSGATVLDKDGMPTANTVALASRRESGLEPAMNWFEEFRVELPENPLPYSEFYIQMKTAKNRFGERFTVRVRRFTEDDL